MLYTKETCMVLDETGIHARENCSRLLRSTAVILDTKETNMLSKDTCIHTKETLITILDAHTRDPHTHKCRICSSSGQMKSALELRGGGLA